MLFQIIYRNKKTSERWIKLKLDFEIGQNFYDRIKKVVDLGLMTDEEIQEFIEMFPNLPNPEHYPMCFEWYVKLFWYYKNKK